MVIELGGKIVYPVLASWIWKACYELGSPSHSWTWTHRTGRRLVDSVGNVAVESRLGTWTGECKARWSQLYLWVDERREDTKKRDLLILTLRNPIEPLSWRPCVCCFSSVTSYKFWSCLFRGPCFLGSSISSGFYTLSSPSWGSLSSVKWFNGDIPFRAECSKVSYSLYNVWLWVSVFVPL